MFGITLETARNVAVAVVGGLVVIAIASAWLVKQIASKLILAGVLVGLALLVWSQRASLDDCAARVQSTLREGAVDDTTCTFFGRDIKIEGRGS